MTVVYPTAMEDSPDHFNNRYMRSSVLVEFGGKNSIEPNNLVDVTPELSNLVPNLIFPAAKVDVLDPERTFWEKATLIHALMAADLPALLNQLDGRTVTLGGVTTTIHAKGAPARGASKAEEGQKIHLLSAFLQNRGGHRRPEERGRENQRDPRTPRPSRPARDLRSNRDRRCHAYANGPVPHRRQKGRLCLHGQKKTSPPRLKTSKASPGRLFP